MIESSEGSLSSPFLPSSFPLAFAQMGLITLSEERRGKEGGKGEEMEDRSRLSLPTTGTFSSLSIEGLPIQRREEEGVRVTV